jgi:hypothetical protein
MEKEFVGKITKIGGSAYACVPKKILDELNLFVGNKIILTIKPILDEQEQESSSIKHYICSICQHQFDSGDEPYCPACGAEENAVTETEEIAMSVEFRKKLFQELTELLKSQTKILNRLLSQESK